MIKMQMIEIQKEPVVLWKAKPICDGIITVFVVNGAISLLFLTRKKSWTLKP